MMQEKMSLNKNHPDTTEEQPPDNVFAGYILAIDATCYSVRMALFDSTSRVVSTFECQPHEVTSACHFVNTICQDYPDIHAVGSPVSRWPSGLEKKLLKQGVKVAWLSPELMREVTRTLAPWNKRRRFHRAGLLAYLAKSNPPPDYRSAREHTLFWEGCKANEILGDVQAELCLEKCEGFAE